MPLYDAWELRNRAFCRDVSPTNGIFRIKHRKFSTNNLFQSRNLLIFATTSLSFRADGSKITTLGIPMPREATRKAPAEGKRRFRTLLFCVLKLRNFESMHSGKASTGVHNISAEH